MTLLRTVLVSMLACAGARAQAPDATIQELLKEVRALRVAIERTNQIGPRVQIALARMQAQEERVRNANRQLADTHERLTGVQSRRAELTENLKQVEAAQINVTDPLNRKQIELQMAEAKAEIERLGAQEQQLRARESEANLAVSTEQGRWNEVDEALRALEKLLVPQQ